jgi:hypothetical protein
MLVAIDVVAGRNYQVIEMTFCWDIRWVLYLESFKMTVIGRTSFEFDWFAPFVRRRSFHWGLDLKICELAFVTRRSCKWSNVFVFRMFVSLYFGDRKWVKCWFICRFSFKSNVFSCSQLIVFWGRVINYRFNLRFDSERFIFICVRGITNKWSWLQDLSLRYIEITPTFSSLDALIVGTCSFSK